MCLTLLQKQFDLFFDCSKAARLDEWLNKQQIAHPFVHFCSEAYAQLQVLKESHWHNAHEAKPVCKGCIARGSLTDTGKKRKKAQMQHFELHKSHTTWCKLE